VILATIVKAIRASPLEVMKDSLGSCKMTWVWGGTVLR
jgi:hypothetical protein